MVTSCAVIGCRSGYKNNPVKTHFFKAPRDPEHLELWRKTINKPSLESKHFICDKHFLQEDILRKKILRAPDGKILGVSPYKIPRLQKNAIPSQFLSQQPASTEQSLPSTPTDAPNVPMNTFETKDDINKSEDFTTPLNISSPSKSASDIKNKRASFEAREDNRSTYFQNNTNLSYNASKNLPLSFDTLLSDVHMPVGWIIQCISRGSERIISIVQRDFFKIDELFKTFIKKEIIIDANFMVQLEILNEEIDLTKLEIPSTFESIHQLRDIIDKVDSLKICSGSHKFGEMPSINCKTVKKDISRSWRHINCYFVISKSTICDFCRKAKKTVATGVRRLQKSLEPKRLSLPTSPTRRRQWLFLKAKLRSTQRHCRRDKNTIEKMKSEVNACRAKMATYKKQTLLDHVEAGNIPQNQLFAVRQILSSAKRKSARGRRYEEEWMLMCLLLHMRSPTEYNFLRNNDILPLPSVRTVRRYMSNINTGCGFDENFFNVLKLAFEKKDEKQKHGLLLIDEISTPESITVDTKELKYQGLVDFGDNQQGINFSEKANHGLVIMFQLLADTYTQPIAVFASRGSVKGHTLAALIVQAINLMEGIGAKIHGVITDGASTNRKFWKTMGVSGEMDNVRNYFPHPIDKNRKVFVFSDTPHLIKTIRNRLYNKGNMQMDPDEELIEWEHIRILHEKDKQSAGPTGNLYCKKLSMDHLDLNSSSKMRVRLAVQVFSRSVYSGLRIFRNVPELRNSEATGKFCLWINNMFDALNGKTDGEGVHPDYVNYKEILDSLRKLNDWERKLQDGKISADKYLTPQTAQGLRVTLQSTLDLIDYLTQDCDFPWVLTGRINQDPLEV